MATTLTIIDDLRDLIGRYADFHGTRCEIIEVLEDGPALVLQDCGDQTSIQADQHGEAHRRVPQTQTVTVPIDAEENYDLGEIGIVLLSD